MIFYKKKYNREEWHDYYALIPVIVETSKEGVDKFVCFKMIERRSSPVGYGGWENEYRLKEK